MSCEKPVRLPCGVQADKIVLAWKVFTFTGQHCIQRPMTSAPPDNLGLPVQHFHTLVILLRSRLVPHKLSPCSRSKGTAGGSTARPQQVLLSTGACRAAGLCRRFITLFSPFWRSARHLFECALPQPILCTFEQMQYWTICAAGWTRQRLLPGSKSKGHAGCSSLCFMRFHWPGHSSYFPQ